MTVQQYKSVSAFAPATVANLAVGFDILGMATDTIGDSVTLTRNDKIGEIKIIDIQGPSEVSGLPTDPSKNTATLGLLKLIEEHQLPHGFNVSIKKGIPLSSGLGGSAASSVAAVIAAQAFIPRKLSKQELLRYALIGETISSGSIHADNVAPALYGGITLISSCESIDSIDVRKIKAPSIYCVLVHPDIKVETKFSRGILANEVSMKKYIQQSSHLASFIVSCYENNLELLKKSCIDLIIEPQRAHLIPGFYQVKEAAIHRGALACSLSGSGPTVFALAANESDAEKINKSMIEAFKKNCDCKIDSWITPISELGARVIHSELL